MFNKSFMHILGILGADNTRSVISGQLLGEVDSIKARVGIAPNLSHVFSFLILFCILKFFVCSLPFLALLPGERMGISSLCASFLFCLSFLGYTRQSNAEREIREARSVILISRRSAFDFPLALTLSMLLLHSCK